ncbi:MAG: hypothetical protein Q8P18_05535 [Pseudomonadota bacterium]|nr:hypothetical protein [Pseudomonadota bacterium]
MWRLFSSSALAVALVLVPRAFAAPPSPPDPARFRLEAPPWSAPRAPSADLGAVAADTLRTLTAAPGVGAGLPGAFTSPTAVADTLAFVARVATEDAATGADRLADPSFLASCFDTWRWVPDVQRPGDALRLTRYLVYAVDGRPTPDATHEHALWAVPRDEDGLSVAQADARRDALDRFRYTRQEVSAGVYREGGAAAGRADPLVWLTHAHHEEALMQGTVAVTLPDGAAPRLYNVHRDNGIPYQRGLSDTRLQRRYWYFRPMDAVRGWGPEPVPGPSLRPSVAVAGDLDALGFGRLLALRSADGLRLVVLADTGGAFTGNLHQLDLYMGVYPSRAAFETATAGVGDTAAAWVMTARVGAAGCE